MRRFITLSESLLTEDQPARLHDPDILPWLEAAHARPDAGELYLHGSNRLFDHFNQPDLQIGQLIFSTKLVERYRSLDYKRQAFQAEYYGRNLYLLKISYQKLFNPHPRTDQQAAAIFAEAIKGQWDYENKVRYGRFDYQDAHLVVPPAVAAGYDFFRIYEVAAQYESYGAAYADMIEIADRYESPHGL
jgi:hypothetical protein